MNTIKKTKNTKTLFHKCYKKHCNKIITKKQLNKKLIKQFEHFEKGKNNKDEKSKYLSLIMKSDNCIKKYCSLEKENYYKPLIGTCSKKRKSHKKS